MCKHGIPFKVIYRISKCVAVKFRDICFSRFFLQKGQNAKFVVILKSKLYFKEYILKCEFTTIDQMERFSVFHAKLRIWFLFLPLQPQNTGICQETCYFFLVKFFVGQ